MEKYLQEMTYKKKSVENTNLLLIVLNLSTKSCVFLPEGTNGKVEYNIKSVR